MSNIDHPEHYCANGIEVIDIIEAYSLGFRLGNTIKYILRSDLKGNRLQDLQKAQWYLTREIEHETREGQADQVPAEIWASCERIRG